MLVLIIPVPFHDLRCRQAGKIRMASRYSPQGQDVGETGRTPQCGVQREKHVDKDWVASKTRLASMRLVLLLASIIGESNVLVDIEIE